MNIALKFKHGGKEIGFVIVKEEVFYGNLDVLRHEMNSQISELLPKEFFFTINKMPVGLKQESFLNTQMVSKHHDQKLFDLETYCLDIKGNKEENLDVFSSTITSSLSSISTTPVLESTNINQSDQNEDATFEKDISGDENICTTKSFLEVLGQKRKNDGYNDRTKTAKKTKINEFFTSPSPNSSKKQTFLSQNKQSSASTFKLKGIKFFDTKELSDNNVSFIEIQRRRFWNKKATAIINTPKYHNWSKHAITGLINSSWTLEKCSHLEQSVKEIKIKINEEQRKDLSFKNIDKN
eukprot:TCONS_00038983-protein